MASSTSKPTKSPCPSPASQAHTAELAGIAANILTLESIDAGTPSDPRKILRMQTVATLLEEYDQLAANALAALQATTDEAFDQTFTLSVKGDPRFTGSRYNAYRNIALNHMIHHRAQLGVYLRLLGRPVPPHLRPHRGRKVRTAPSQRAYTISEQPRHKFVSLRAKPRKPRILASGAKSILPPLGDPSVRPSPSARGTPRSWLLFKSHRRR